MQIKPKILQGQKPEMVYITGVKSTINPKCIYMILELLENDKILLFQFLSTFLIWFMLFGENENVMWNEIKNIIENIVENMLRFTLLT